MTIDKKEITNCTRCARLRAALELARYYFCELPGGIDIDADEDNPSPDDMSAHIGGLAVRAIDEALDCGREDESR